MSTLKIGLIGVGRMGRMYGQYLARQAQGVALVAVADQKAELAKSFAAEFEIPRWHSNHQDLLNDGGIDAVLVVAYLAAKQKLEAGAIGEPVMFTSISRDPYPPPLEFCDPKVSGGLIADMGVHDFDVARMYMGEVRRVHAIGGVLAYPEMKSVGDIDNAIVDLVFQNGAMGVVQLSRNAAFGYDIRGEIWGTKGSIQIGYYRQTPIVTLTPEGVTHDAVPYFMERFENAYLAQIRNFVEHLQKGLPPSITGADAMAALRITLAANLSLREHRPVEVEASEAERHRA